MEPENHLFEEEIIFQTFIFGFHVNFQGCRWFRNPAVFCSKLTSVVENFPTICGVFSFRKKNIEKVVNACISENQQYVLIMFLDGCLGHNRR